MPFKIEIELSERVRTPDDVSRALFSLANQVMGDSWEQFDSGPVVLDGNVVGEWRVEADGPLP